MKELWLNFKDENGDAKRVLVEGERFSIGRTPDNDLPIPVGNLSRQHARIERFADVFIVSDCGSSNGSTINDQPLTDPLALKNGDVLNLGAAVEITAEFPSDASEKDGADDVQAVPPDANRPSPKQAPVAAPASSSSALWLLMIAPIVMVLILLGLGGAILAVRSRGQTDIVTSPTDLPTVVDESETPVKSTPAPTATATNTVPISSPGGNSNPTTPAPTVGPTEELPAASPRSDDSEKLKTISADFLRRIANEPRAFLREKQVEALKPKISQLRGSATLAENIKNAKKSLAQIKQIADSKSLKPQFLAVAALAKLGNNRGDVSAVAAEISEPLSDIIKTFGSDTADDGLLIIAAYKGKKSGEQLQATAGGFTKNNLTNAKEIRSIWFFKEKDKLSADEFEFALQFLAIGTITQNPREFNVSAEALVF